MEQQVVLLEDPVEPQRQWTFGCRAVDDAGSVPSEQQGRHGQAQFVDQICRRQLRC